MSRLHWIDCPHGARLAVSARPRGGEALDAEVAAWAQDGVRLVTSLLSEWEVEQLELTHAPEVCATHGIELIRLPIRDLDVLAIEEGLSRQVATLAERALAGEPVLMHCRMGIGRATMMAVALLAHLGLSPEEAWPRVREARGCEVPDTQAQFYWTLEYAGYLHSDRAEDELDNLLG